MLKAVVTSGAEVASSELVATGWLHPPEDPDGLWDEPPQEPEPGRPLLLEMLAETRADER